MVPCLDGLNTMETLWCTQKLTPECEGAWAEGFPTVLVELKLMHSVHSPFHLDKASAVTTDILRMPFPSSFLHRLFG